MVVSVYVEGTVFHDEGVFRANSAIIEAIAFK